MRADLRSFFERSTVVELLLAFVFATTIVSFISALVYGVVITPIQDSAHDSSPLDNLSASIDGRVFEFTNILLTGAVLLVVTLAAARLLRSADPQLWDENATRTCPHCLSEIPAGASVCSYCTRDVPAAADG
jgi:large conductance mechanosensitive channel